MSDQWSTGDPGYPEGDQPPFSGEVTDLIDQAWEALEGDDLVRFRDKFNEARDLEPDNHAIDVEMADALFDLGRLEEALALCQTVLEIDVDVPRARRLAALALNELGRPAQSLPMLAEELEQHPNDASLLVSMGDVMGAMGRYGESETFYAQALAFDDNIWGAHHGMGLCMVQRENYKSAIEHYRAALELDDNQPEVWVAWADLLVSLGQHSEARERILRAIEIDDEYGEAWERLNFVSEQLSLDEEGLFALRRAIFWSPMSEDLLDHLALRYHPPLKEAHSFEVTLTGQYAYPDAVPPDRTHSEPFRRSYQVWAPDEQAALEMICEMEASMWAFEYRVEDVVQGASATHCHGGVMVISDRIYEIPTA